MSNRGIGGSKHAAIMRCHRCGNHYYSKKLLDSHLATCDPWALDVPDPTRKTHLPLQGPDGRAPTIHFKHSYQRHKVPLYVVADCETYREGDSNAHVASFAWTVVGSELYLKSSKIGRSSTRRATPTSDEGHVAGPPLSAAEP